MNGPITSCETCGQGITDEDLGGGNAIRVLGKSFCVRCKGEAIKNIALEDIGKPTPKKPIPVRQSGGGPPKPIAPPRPAAATPPAAKPAQGKPPAKPATPPPEPPKRSGVDIVEIDIPDKLPAPVPARQGEPRFDPAQAKPEAARATPRRRTPLKPASRSRTPLLIIGIGIALVGVAAGVGLLLLPRKDGGPKPPVAPANGETPDPTPKPPADAREERARKAFDKAQTLATRPEAGYDEILAALDQARDACRGTTFDAKLETLRNKVLREREMVGAQKQYRTLLDELKAAVASDTPFKRYGELRPKFQQARDLATRVGTNALSEVQQLHVDYSGRYEKEANRFFGDIKDGAAVLADERRFDAALQMIETFPAHLRHSGAWRELERLKQDVERRKKGK